MINITIALNGYKVVGHADYAEHGRDIVCSAVSALTQTTLLGLEKYSSVDYMISEGNMEVYVTENNRISMCLINTMLMGLGSIQQEYPKYVNIQVVDKLDKE